MTRLTRCDDDHYHHHHHMLWWFDGCLSSQTHKVIHFEKCECIILVQVSFLYHSILFLPLRCWRLTDIWHGKAGTSVSWNAVKRKKDRGMWEKTWLLFKSASPFFSGCRTSIHVMYTTYKLHHLIIHQERWDGWEFVFFLSILLFPLLYHSCITLVLVVL
jgi:hypothetical protein